MTTNCLQSLKVQSKILRRGKKKKVKSKLSNLIQLLNLKPKMK